MVWHPELPESAVHTEGHGCQAYTVDSLCLSIQMSQPRLAPDERVKANARCPTKRKVIDSAYRRTNEEHGVSP